ncbi:hypothetical protein HGRIS_006586 [Hohenbuehelia grisea]|uniref:Uncharacterized protein n=1 Tax=Hohenbuehelia grisea TaxID=104357 RepID=A0ABR3J9R7_9AGAR
MSYTVSHPSSVRIRVARAEMPQRIYLTITSWTESFVLLIALRNRGCVSKCGTNDGERRFRNGNRQAQSRDST